MSRARAARGGVESANQVAVGVAVRLLVFTGRSTWPDSCGWGRTGPGSPWRLGWAGSGPCRW